MCCRLAMALARVALLRWVAVEVAAARRARVRRTRGRSKVRQALRRLLRGWLVLVRWRLMLSALRALWLMLMLALRLAPCELGLLLLLVLCQLLCYMRDFTEHHCVRPISSVSPRAIRP